MIRRPTEGRKCTRRPRPFGVAAGTAPSAHPVGRATSHTAGGRGAPLLAPAVLAAGLLLGALFVAGCGDDGPPGGVTTTASSAPGAPDDTTGSTTPGPTSSTPETAPGSDTGTTGSGPPSPPPTDVTSTTTKPGYIAPSTATPGRSAPDVVAGDLTFSAIRVLPDPATGRFAVQANVTNTGREFLNGVSVAWSVVTGGGSVIDQGAFAPVSLASGETTALNAVGSGAYRDGWGRVEFTVG